MDASRTLIVEMNHAAKIDSSRFMISPALVKKIRDLSTLLVVVINILMLIFYKLDSTNYRDIEINSKATLAIDVINGFQILFSLLLLISYILSNGTLILNRKWEQCSSNLKKVYDRDESSSYDELERVHEEMDERPVSQTWMLLTNLKYLEVDGKRKYGSWFTGLVYYCVSTSFLLTDGMFIYYLWYLTFSVIGIAISPIYYSFLLLDFIIRFDSLRNVIQSVTKNIIPLLLTGMLILIILFVYASFGFFYFRDMLYNYNINPNDSLVGESMCDTMLSCYVNIINYGLRNGGGIGDAAVPENYLNYKSYHTKLLYTFSFHLIVIVVMLNIVFGIIIDTFAQLRDEKRECNEDQTGKCFICNLEEYLFFEHEGAGFDAHVKDDHNMWNYLFYIVHLESKDETEYSGVESYVRGKYDKEDVSWMPLHKAMAIDSHDDEVEELAEQEALKKKLEGLNNRLSIAIRKLHASQKERNKVSS